MRAGIKNRTNSGRAVHASYRGRAQHAVFRFSRREFREGESEGEVGRCETKEDSERHGLAVVEFRVWWPARVVDVGFIPVGEERACCVEEVA